MIGSLGEVEASPLYGINEYDRANPIVIIINKENNFIGFV